MHLPSMLPLSRLPAHHIWLQLRSAGFALQAPTSVIKAKRDLSDSSGYRRNGIRTALHSLYKLVHPDLFTQFPTEKVENERSLKLLQEYIARSESVDGRSLAYSTVYSFVFYLKGNASSTSNEPGEHYKQPAGPQLQKVAITLPPPAPTLAEGQLSLTGRKGLNRLLQACGLPELDIVDNAGGSPLGSHLLAFLPQAVEDARLKERSTVQLGIRIASLRGAMRFGRKVLVVVDNKQLDPAQQVKLLEALARVLDTLPTLDLAGCRVALSNCTGISPTGQLLLNTEEMEDEWAFFLEQVDLSYCRQLQDRLEGVKQLEQMVATAMGVAMVYTTPNFQLHADYRVFLEHMSVHAMSCGPAQAGQLKEVPVMVIPAMGASTEPIMLDAAAEGHVDSSMGCVRLSVLTDAAKAYSILQVHGLKALAIRQRKEAEDNFESTVTDSARKVLHLRRLNRDEAVSHKQYVAACKLLMQHRAELADILDGQSVRVSTSSGVATDGSFIDIAWDCEL